MPSSWTIASPVASEVSPPISKGDGKRKPPGYSYPADVVAFARKLAGDLGIGAGKIAALLQNYGYPSLNQATVWRWIEPERKRAEEIGLHLSHMRAIGTTPIWRLRLERMQELRNANVPYSSIAKVMQVDFGITLSREQIARILKGETRNARRVLTDPPSTLAGAESAS